jgi:hypothetical protein
MLSPQQSIPKPHKKILAKNPKQSKIDHVSKTIKGFETLIPRSKQVFTQPVEVEINRSGDYKMLKEFKEKVRHEKLKR